MAKDEFLGLTEWSTTQDEGYFKIELWFYLIFAILLGVLIIFLINKNFKHRDLSERWLLFRISAVLIIGFMILMIFVFEVIEIWISVNGSNSNFIWTLLNGLIAGILGVAIYPSKSRNAIFTIFFLVVIVYVALSGFGFIGYLIKLNLEFLTYKKYENNTIRGVYFITLNLPFIFLVYFLSFIPESEVRD